MERASKVTFPLQDLLNSGKLSLHSTWDRKKKDSGLAQIWGHERKPHNNFLSVQGKLEIRPDSHQKDSTGNSLS